jgi:hypothetical protein
VNKSAKHQLIAKSIHLQDKLTVLNIIQSFHIRSYLHRHDDEKHYHDHFHHDPHLQSLFPPKQLLVGGWNESEGEEIINKKMREREARGRKRETKRIIREVNLESHHFSLRETASQAVKLLGSFMP